MVNIYDLISRAQKLREETKLDSVSPDRVGALCEDTLKYINEFQLLASSPSLHKIYASVSAMQADKSPKSDLTGKALKPGQLVVIVPANQSDATAGDVYRYDGPSGNTSAWTYISKIGPVFADAELNTASANPIQNKIVAEKLTELKISNDDFVNSLIKELYIDFGDSGYTLADVGKIYYNHKYTDALALGLYTSSYVNMWGGSSYHYDPGDILDVTSKGIRVRAILNIADKPLQEDTTYINVKLSEKCTVLEEMPILFEAERFSIIEASLSENSSAIQKNAELIDSNKAEIELKVNVTDSYEKSYRHMQGLTGLNDAEYNTIATGCNLYAIRVKEGERITLKHKIFLNSEKTSYSWAIISSDTWNYNSGTILQRGEQYTGSLVKEITESILIPKGGKWLIFINRSDYSAIVSAVNNIPSIISNTSYILDNKPASRTVVYVGKNKSKSGGYETIQEAINDIQDASVINQYELRLCDDETYNDPALLWNVSDTSVHAASNPSEACAAVITKDYIHILGYNRRRKVAVYAPDGIADGSIQFIQALWLQGNVEVDNVDFEVRNARYAIHQESGGKKNSPDYNARTVLRNSKVTHLGQQAGATWTSCYAQANGACSGLEVEYHNVEWYPAFYMHQNSNFDLRNKYLFDRCRVKVPADGKVMGVDIGMYIGMNGSCQNSEIIFTGCDMYSMYFDIGMMPGNTMQEAAHDVRTMIPVWNGYGNLPMRMPEKDFTGVCVAFKTDALNKSLEVRQSEVKTLIYGEDLFKWDGASNAYGLCVGTEFIGSRGNDYAYTLAHRLGNCLDNRKTLVLAMDGVTKTISFAENFVTADGSNYTNSTPPAWSDDKIRTYISEQLKDSGISLAYYEGTRVGFPMSDAAEYGHNYNDYALMSGAALVRDNNLKGWKYCPEGRRPEAIAVTRINPNEGGLVALVDKNYFRWMRGMSYTPVYAAGTYAKVVQDGKVSITEAESDADFVCVANNTWKVI